MKKEINTKIEKIDNLVKNSNLETVEKLFQKDEKIEKLKKKLKRFLPYKLSEGEKLMSIIIQSIDQKIHISVICKNTDIFSFIEKKIYEKKEYYDYSELDTFFTVNGNKVNKYKTLDENKIHDNDIVMLNVKE